jgi:hypothetical protein
MRDLFSTSLKDSIDRSSQTDDQSKFDESHKHKIGLIRELTTWKDRAASEYEMREKAQKERNQLKETILEMQIDNQKKGTPLLRKKLHRESLYRVGMLEGRKWPILVGEPVWDLLEPKRVPSPLPV